MENLNDISFELKQLSPLLAGMEKMNVFSLPEGYFDDLSDRLMDKLKLPVNFTGVANQPAVPEGYFDHLPAMILDRIKSEQSAIEEIKMLSPLLSPLRDNNVFLVPDNYFETFPVVVINTLTGTADDELKQLSPLLLNIRNANVFEVPVSYFDELAPKIAAASSAPAAKIVYLSPVKTIWRYAVAAMVTGIIAFGLYNITYKPADNTAPGFTAVKMDAAIEKGIKMDDRQFTEAMKKLTDSEIVNYLEKNGDIADISALRNTIDEEQLPDPEDYLLNNNTLDNYLEKLQLSLTN